MAQAMDCAACGLRRRRPIGKRTGARFPGSRAVAGQIAACHTVPQSHQLAGGAGMINVVVDLSHRNCEHGLHRAARFRHRRRAARAHAGRGLFVAEAASPQIVAARPRLDVRRLGRLILADGTAAASGKPAVNARRAAKERRSQASSSRFRQPGRTARFVGPGRGARAAHRVAVVLLQTLSGAVEPLLAVVLQQRFGRDRCGSTRVR